MRVVVDTNVVISRYLTPSGTAAQVMLYWEQQAYELLVSEAILDEYQRVLNYPRIVAQHQLSADEVAEIIEDFRELSRVIDPVIDIHIISADPDDDKFLACAITGEADYIVSGDPHLRALGSYGTIRILSPGLFVALFHQSEDTFS